MAEGDKSDMIYVAINYTDGQYSYHRTTGPGEYVVLLPESTVRSWDILAEAAQRLQCEISRAENEQVTHLSEDEGTQDDEL